MSQGEVVVAFWAEPKSGDAMTLSLELSSFLLLKSQTASRRRKSDQSSTQENRRNVEQSCMTQIRRQQPKTANIKRNLLGILGRR
jgi:hypothetical protein